MGKDQRCHDAQVTPQQENWSAYHVDSAVAEKPCSTVKERWPMGVQIIDHINTEEMQG